MMSLKAVFVMSGVFSLGFATFFLGSQGKESKPTILKRQVDGLQLEFFVNSATLSQALGISSDGALIGYKEVPNKDFTIFRNAYLFCSNDLCKEMPRPEGFTNAECNAISDNHWVVGRVSRPIGAEDGSLRAVVWDAKKSSVDLLPRPQDDTLSDAHDISADGTRITGYATGHERLRPVLWSFEAQSNKWTVTVLPTLHDLNPYLMSAQLVISPDGKTIAGCCTDKFLEDGTVDSALFAWTEVGGKWERKKLFDEQIYVKAMNNKGQIVGSAVGRKGRIPCVATLDGKLTYLKLLEGDVGGEARDINENSEIVGWSDDPHGNDGGSTPCRWNVNGEVTEMKLGESGFGFAYAINNSGQIAGSAEVVFPANELKGSLNQAAADNADEETAAMLMVRATKLK